MSSISVKIENVTKKFGNVIAVDNLSLDIKAGELFTLLGPSGCGKTTLLRTIAGFNIQESGSIYFGDDKIDHITPHKRDTGMVFQSYAVFPFMSVFDNVAYGLKVRKLGKKEIQKKVMNALSLVRLDGYENRRPNQLSGGQRQRVAVARAIAIEPRVLLMDEPLSNLDAKLRVDMRVDIRRLQKKLGITMIYVTHDQEEALAISDKIAVMEEGRLAQVSSAWDIYNNPASPYVANFIGVSNFFDSDLLSVSPESGTVKIRFQGQELIVPGDVSPENTAIVASIRPEALNIIKPDFSIPEKYCTFKCRVFDTTYIGASLRITAVTESDEKFQIEVNNPGQDDLYEEGMEFQVGFDLKDVIVFTGGKINA